MTEVAFPLRFDWRGRTAEATPPEHVRDLVEQVLFTDRGERAMRPDFGAGLLHLIFESSAPALAGSGEALILGALQQWLGELIEVAGVEVESEESSLVVTVRYAIKPAGGQRVERFERTVPR